MTEQEYSDQWPESLRIMREQRERIAALEAALQDKCHGLPETDYVAFCDGCDGYQREKFGKCRTDALEAEVERLRADAERRLKLLRQVYDQIGNHAPAERRHAVTPGCRDSIRDELNAARAAGGER